MMTGNDAGGGGVINFHPQVDALSTYTITLTRKVGTIIVLLNLVIGVKKISYVLNENLADLCFRARH